MKETWILEGAGEQILRLKRPGGGGRSGDRIEPLLTVQQVCRRLKKSRRQVYRYLRAGRLTACARILGQWLFDAQQMDRFNEASLPASFRRFFWDVPLSSLSVERHRDFILGRLLEWGDREALRWVVRSYSPDVLREFLRGRGSEILSERNQRFWASVLELKRFESATRSWRRRGRAWGGMG